MSAYRRCPLVEVRLYLRSNNKTKGNKDGQGRRRLTRIANDELKAKFFKDAKP